MSPGLAHERQTVHKRWQAAMRAGDFAAAWRETDTLEHIRRARGGRCVENGELLWNGDAFAGRHVLVRCLHGLGDTLQFVRFVPQIAAIARQLTLAVQPALVPLFPPHGEFGEVRDGWTDQPFVWDLEIEIMELAYALRVTAETLPRSPYLNLDWIRGQSRFHPLSRAERPRVGLIWQASSWDHTRSIPPESLESWAEVPVQWISLQQETTPAVVPLPIDDLAPHTRSVIDAARALLDLDLLVTVDAMPAHLAGALGCPVWILLKADADWRWMRGRSSSPWYPSMRLFRQRVTGDWKTPLGAVAKALKSFTTTRRTCSNTSLDLREGSDF